MVIKLFQRQIFSAPGRKKWNSRFHSLFFSKIKCRQTWRRWPIQTHTKRYLARNFDEMAPPLSVRRLLKILEPGQSGARHCNQQQISRKSSLSLKWGCVTEAECFALTRNTSNPAAWNASIYTFGNNCRNSDTFSPINNAEFCCSFRIYIITFNSLTF